MRPTPTRLRELLMPPSPSVVVIGASRKGRIALRAAAEKLAVSSAEHHLAEFTRRKRDAERAKLARAAYDILRPILRGLFEILEAENLDRRPQEEPSDWQAKWEMRFGPATLSVEFHNLQAAMAHS